ncbi:hypothetical protein [Clostridium beijerinckii]|uniref:hypothetical protein n=1 Tax=Clostridium beijerinckii TaxID=1520 RepID=UPI00098C25A3|nr:hypothetical protein [Clostridium beijerinckii]MBA8935787.1 hypothetical protein [Clostridium beijerinckii]NRU40257.1 hypothetical protein [Clostridium beijerinckii]NSA96541.1 hypothetical protein [Clostridium beijerinckii]OOM53185.1 hypothetical protein CLOBI_50810 [Clostridium beijerinckii]OOM70358.1 hypothetical protein CLBEIC_20220 [Clostridium beijerinckii]
MIFLGLEKIDDTKAKVVLIHYFPDQLTEEEKSKGVLVESLPIDEGNKDGKLKELRYSYESNTAYYEYVDIPKSELELLKEQVNDLAQANAELTSIVAMGKTNA